MPSIADRVKRALFVLISALLAGPAVRPSAAGDDVDGVVERADRLRAGGDAVAAVELLRPLAGTEAGAADLRVAAALARALVASGDAGAALPWLRAVVKARPQPEERIALASALLATAKDRIAGGARLSVHVVPYLEDAILEAAAATSPDPALARRRAVVAAEAHLLLDRPARAKEALASISVEGDPAAEDLAGRASYALGEFAAAADAWGRAGRIEARAAAWSAAKDPRAIAAWAALALAHLEDPALADRAIRGASYVDGGEGLEALLAAAVVPSDQRAALARVRGRLAERRGLRRDAVLHARAVVLARPDDIDARRDLARALLALSTEDASATAEAIELLRSVLASRPDDAETRAGLDWQARADASNAHREWPDRRGLDRAVSIFRVLAETAPDDALAWSQYGNATRIAGDVEASIAAFDRATATGPYDASIWNDRGIALLAAGRGDDALASFEHAIGLDPSDVAPRQNVARLLRRRARDDEADAHLGAALRTARALSGSASLYRALLDRGYRARHREALR